MNAGLTNLETLRRFVLPATMLEDRSFDEVILTIGLGVAGLFDQVCNRKFAYAENDVLIFTGNRPHYYLPRYPLVSVAKIEMRYFMTDAWTDITGQPISMNEQTGLVHFGYTLGRDPLQVRATWTGGFWFETLEPDEDGYPSAMPAGATALPDVVRAAFLLQSQHLWQQRDNLGTSLADKPGRSPVQELEMSPMVKQMLQQFIRYQLS